MSGAPKSDFQVGDTKIIHWELGEKGTVTNVKGNPGYPSDTVEYLCEFRTDEYEW